jgi:hypothetical protein
MLEEEIETYIAFKTANRGYTDIRLRERGTKKVHIFTGERIQIDKPESAPAWMGDKICKPQVKKMGIEKIKIFKVALESILTTE